VAASEVWLFFLYAWRKAETEQFQAWQVEWFIRNWSSEPAEHRHAYEMRYDSLLSLFHKAGFGNRRVKFCKPCNVEIHTNRITKFSVTILLTDNAAEIPRGAERFLKRRLEARGRFHSPDSKFLT
jgi:hypothetical protein